MILARGFGALAVAGLLSGVAQAQELKPVKIGVVNLSTDVAFYIAEKRVTSKRKVSRPTSPISIPAPR